MTDHEKKELGWKTEEAFRKMLDRAGIPYLPFCDNMDKFSPVLRDLFHTKRPDVMILLRYFGFLIVDIKHKKITEEHPDFLFDSEEAEKYAHFRKAFGHEVWYAVSNPDIEFKNWFMIPSLEVMKGHKEIKIKDGSKCYIVPPSHCIQISSFQDLFQALFSSSTNEK